MFLYIKCHDKERYKQFTYWHVTLAHLLSSFAMN